jgi:hypothetical protein
MRAVRASLLPIVSALSLSACSLFEDDTVCAGVGSWNVAVTVVDSISGVSSAANATLLTYDIEFGGVRIDSVTGQKDTDVLMGSDRKGRYTVVVRKVGYRDWVKSPVVVVGECTVQTVALTARLARP